MGSLSDKVAIVTGGAFPRGFGYATAKLFAEEGAKVILTDLVADAVESRAAELRETGLAVVASAHDVTDEASWQAVFALAADEFGVVDVLVNNAGFEQLTDIETTSLEIWDKHISVNVTGVFLGCQSMVKHLRSKTRKGSIINISSIAGLSAHPNACAYVASKGAVRLLTKTVALDVAAEGIRVNTVIPGMMLTDMTARAISQAPELANAVEAGIPMGKMGGADDIAAMNRFLASDESKYITGAEFVVDGGLTAK